MPTRTSKYTDFSTLYVGGYRYSFNGMERDDEVSGVGNSYTAEFWQYDSRLGRRWNIDPVVKSERSPYDAFSNNPIIMIDPKGDDDYFHEDGTYSHSTSKGHNIYVGKKLFNEIPLNSPNNIKIAEKVVRNYANQLGLKYEYGNKNKGAGVIKVKPNPDGNSSDDKPAYNKGLDIFINSANGVLASSLSNYHQLKSTLFHENLHKNGMNGEGLAHAKVYSKQMEQLDFKRSTQEFKDKAVGGMLGEIVEGLESFDSATDVNKFLTDFNDKNSKTLGYKVEYAGSGNDSVSGKNYQFNIVKGDKKTSIIINSDEVKK